MWFLQLIGLLILAHFFLKIYSVLGEEKRGFGVVKFEVEANLQVKMLGIFKENLVNPPQELNSPASLDSSRKPKQPSEILQDFMNCNPTNAFSMNFGNDALLAYVSSKISSLNHRYLCFWCL